MSAAPLQVTSAFAAIANGGELLQPMIVNKIIDKDGNLIRENERQVINNELVGSNNLAVIKRAMKETVEYGSATMFQSLPVSSGAKTGTAQIPKKDHFNNWITVFAPYDNPEIVLTILIEEVEGIRAAALPVAKEVLEWYFKGSRG
jgi:penicillin-binding protein 2